MAEQRLIDANELIKFIRKLSPSPFNEWDTQGVLNAVERQPTVVAKPVVHGRWDTTETVLGRCCICSVCGSCPSLEYHFCPYCGADMRGGENG